MTEDFNKLLSTIEAISKRLDNIEKWLILSQKEALTVKDLSEYLGISEGRIRVLVCNRQIPYHKRGKLVTFNKSEIDDWQLQYSYPSMDDLDNMASNYIAKRKI